MKSSLFIGLLTSTMISGVYGASYSTDFNSYTAAGTDIAGQDGWTISDSTDQFSQVVDSNANPADPFSVSQALNLGDASAVDTIPTGSSVVLNHAYSAAIGTTSLTFDMIIADSRDGAFTNRDQFGVSFSNSGSNVFSLAFIPVSQSATPNSGTVAQWNVSYTIGANPASTLNLGVLENSQYHIDLSFNPNAGNPLLSDFMLNITSAVPNTLNDGGIGVNLNPNSVVDGFNVSWSKVGASALGSNSIVIDNLGVVPEPSSYLLLSLAALGVVARRKRA